MLFARSFRCLLSLTLGASLGACGSSTEPTSRRTPAAAAAGSGWPSSPTSTVGGVAGASSGAIPLAGAGSVPPAQSTPINSNGDGVCEVVHLTADLQTPDMMIVLDRSGSMTEGGRWQPSVSAVRRITMELQSRIRFGLALFPDPAVKDATGVLTGLTDCFAAADPQKCLDELTAMTATGVCAPGAVVVPIGDSNAMAIGKALDSTQPTGGTPTSATLERLVTTYANEPAGPDSIGVHAKYVLLVTDGQPTCPAGQGQETTQPDIDASNKAIEALLAKDVRTYVIGYDTTGAGNEKLASVLDGFATRGGTGDTMHRPVENEASLVMELQKITGQIVGCSFTLDKAPSRADFVRVTLDGRQVNLGEANGWRMEGDRTVELTGAACDTFRSGGSHLLDAEVQCSVVGPT
jgi:hypothetical protein